MNKDTYSLLENYMISCAEGKRLACGRQRAAAAFYNDLYREVQESYEGKDLLGDLLA